MKTLHTHPVQQVPGTHTNRPLHLFDQPTRTLQAAPKARLKPRRSTGLKGDQRAPLVRQTAVSFDGSIIVACHDDGSITRCACKQKVCKAAAGLPAG